jgi:hypothetical protein
MAIKKVVLDALLAGTDGKDVFRKNGLFDAFKKGLGRERSKTS